MPDDELLRLAESRKLQRSDGAATRRSRGCSRIRSRRRSPRTSPASGSRREASTRRSRDPTKFPEWDPELRDAMRTETRMFFDAVLRENRPISDFIDGKYTFLNERLAKHYGIAGVEGPAFRRVELTTASAQRRVHAGERADRLELSDADVAGAARQVPAGERAQRAAAAPPADVPALDEEGVGVARIAPPAARAASRGPAVRVLPHARWTRWASRLENYDAIGRWRTEDGKLPIDPTGEFPTGGLHRAGRAEDAPARTTCRSSPAAWPRRC